MVKKFNFRGKYSKLKTFETLQVKANYKLNLNKPTLFIRPFTFCSHFIILPSNIFLNFFASQILSNIIKRFILMIDKKNIS